jgi:hypothetical protein
VFWVPAWHGHMIVYVHAWKDKNTQLTTMLRSIWIKYPNIPEYRAVLKNVSL